MSKPGIQWQTGPNERFGGITVRLLRCCLTGLAATALAALALVLLLPGVVSAPARPLPGFEAVLVRGCSAAAGACVLWGWVGALAVVGEALHGTRRTPGVPRGLRRLVLTGCGVALSAAAAPVLATSGAGAPLPAAVAGLPFPERAMDSSAQVAETVVVRPGDSLWRITARHLPAEASDADVTAGWHHLYADNRAVVGDDPSLIHPGQHLVLPDDLQEQP
jgi:hypothetical protein